MNRLSVVLCGLLLTALPSTSALADTTYTYTGNPFTFALLPYTTSDSISGFFTVDSPLGANLAVSQIFPTDFSFTDGISTISDIAGTFSVFDVSTDSSGSITAWIFSLQAPNTSGIGSANIAAGGTEMDQAIEGLSPDGLGYIIGASNDSDPGTWTSVTADPSTVPEPSSLILLGSGLIGIAGAVRRRLVS